MKKEFLDRAEEAATATILFLSPVLVVTVTVCIIILLMSSMPKKSVNDFPGDGMMQVVEITDEYAVLVHKETGVMYLVLTGLQARTVCVMADEEGKPLIYNEMGQAKKQ